MLEMSQRGELCRIERRMAKLIICIRMLSLEMRSGIRIRTTGVSDERCTVHGRSEIPK